MTNWAFFHENCRSLKEPVWTFSRGEPFARKAATVIGHQENGAFRIVC
jgi:hypothetical protein